MRALTAKATTLAVAAAWLAACGGRVLVEAGPADASDNPWPDVPQVPQPTVLAEDLASPCGVAAGTDALYVAEEGGGRVLRLPLDGAPATEVGTGLDGPSMLAVRGDDVFVTERVAGNVLRLRAGATTTLAATQARPGRVKIDADGAFVYWVAEGTGVADGAVRRAPVEGGPVEDVATGLDAPRGLALTASRAYWTDAAGRRVGFAPIAGGAATTITDTEGYPADVLVDEAAGDVFWTSPGRRGGGWIHRADLDLGGDTLLTFSPPGPAWLALDDAYLVWSTSQTLTRAERAGGAYEDLTVEVAVCDFVLVARTAYWADASTGRVLGWPMP